MFKDDEEIPPPPPLLDAHRIIAFSLDADGCLFNDKYLLDHKLIPGNTALLSHMLHQAEYIKLIILVGSNRQSYDLDQHNSIQNKTMSCFVAVKDITNYLSIQLIHQDVWLDRFLMADIYQDLFAGTAFNQAIDPFHTGPHAETVFDRSKITLLYAQIHKLANDHKGKRILYHFYDDRYDLLTGLNNFFQNHLEWIPRNVKVNLHFYIGDDPCLFAEFTGTGGLDPHYREHVKWMADLSYVFPISGEGYDTIKALIHYERYHNGHLQITSPYDWTPTGLLTSCDSTFFKTITASTEPSPSSHQNKKAERPISPSEPNKKNPIYFLIKRNAALDLVTIIKPDFQSDIDSQLKFVKLDITTPLTLHKNIHVNGQKYMIKQHYIRVDEVYDTATFYSDYCYIAHLTTTSDCNLKLYVFFNAQDTSVEVSLHNEASNEIISIIEAERYSLNALASMYCATILGPLHQAQSALECRLVEQINSKIHHLLSLPTTSKEHLEKCIAWSNALLNHRDEYEYHKKLQICLDLVFQYKRILDLKYTALISDEYDKIDEYLEHPSKNKQQKIPICLLPECMTSLKMSRLNHRLDVKVNRKPTELSYFEAVNAAIASLATFTEEMTIDSQSIILIYTCLIESIDASINKLHQALLIGDNETTIALSHFAPLLPYTIFKTAIDSANNFILKWLLRNENIALNRVRIEFDTKEYTLLEYAFIQRKLSYFELLLNHGASPMLLTTNGEPLAYFVLNHENEFNKSLRTYLDRVGICDVEDQIPSISKDFSAISLTL